MVWVEGARAEEGAYTRLLGRAEAVGRGALKRRMQPSLAAVLSALPCPPPSRPRTDRLPSLALPQVKFYRPTTGTLLRSAYDYLLHNLSSSSPSSSSPQAAEESDDVVARLLAVKHDQRLWLRALGELFDKGYRPELVFIDAGLVTCLDERNRRNFLDLSVWRPLPLFAPFSLPSVC